MQFIANKFENCSKRECVEKLTKKNTFNKFFWFSTRYIYCKMDSFNKHISIVFCLQIYSFQPFSFLQENKQTYKG